MMSLAAHPFAAPMIPGFAPQSFGCAPPRIASDGCSTHQRHDAHVMHRRASHGGFGAHGAHTSGLTFSTTLPMRGSRLGVTISGSAIAKVLLTGIGGFAGSAILGLPGAVGGAIAGYLLASRL